MASRTENLSSQLDGSNMTFTLSRPFINGTLIVIVNGLFMTPLVDFITLSPTTFQLTSNAAPPESGEMLWVMFEPVVPPATTGGGGGSPGDHRVIGLPGGGQIPIYY